MKETCQFYHKTLKRCIALKEVYCDKEDCSFYKPKGETAWMPKHSSDRSVWKDRK